MSLAENATGSTPPPRPSVPLNLIEAAFKEEVIPHASFRPMDWGDQEREHMRKRVANFRQHQERLRCEREDYYARTMLRARKIADGVADEAAEPLKPPQC
jgi:hypothetical protein